MLAVCTSSAYEHDGLKGRLVVAAVAIAVVAVATVALTMSAQAVHRQPDHAAHCFAEWCVRPLDTYASSGATTIVDLTVSSTAKGTSQRPDHPQAWVTAPGGRLVGGRQDTLSRSIAPQGSYVVELNFRVTLSGCTDFVVAEGAWPAFLGLGYAPSPFTERVSWRLCPSNGLGNRVNEETGRTAGVSSRIED